MASESRGADAAASSTAKTQDHEMSTLEAPSTSAAERTGQSQGQSQPQEEEQRRDDGETVAGAQQTTSPSPSSAAQPSSSTPQDTTRKASATNPPLTRTQTEALGPATDSPIAPPPVPTGPTLSITLMLTTGARHPYKIDEKYLTNRKVESVKSSDGKFDPREISAYKLKELIWTDWRSEWEPRPASPSAIRLIILGRLMDDKAALKDFPFKMDDTNVVHMTVKPADFLDDDDTGGKGTGKGHSIRGRDGESREAGCRCVIL